MIRVDCEQLSDDWFAARTGVASASNFSKIITPSGKPSASSDDYLYELVAEYVTGEKKQITPSFWMERGIEMEPEARNAYEFITDQEVEQVGFIYRDESRLVGCSPDGLLDGKGLEIKCPAPITHVSYLLQGVCPKAYVAQLQGSMWVTGFESWVFMSFHPDYESLIIEVEADDAYQKALDKVMPPFLDRLATERESERVQAMIKRRLEAAA